MFYLFFPVSAVVFGLGVLNRFGIFPIDMKVDNVAFISTIGNINWYCGYLVTVFFAGCYLFVKKKWEKKWQKWLMGGYLVIGYASLMTQGSESGMMALAVACVVLFCMATKDVDQMLAFWQEMILMCGACVGLWVVRRVFGGELTFKGMFIDWLSASAFPFLALFAAVLMEVVIWGLRKKELYSAKVSHIFAWIVGMGSIIGVITVIALIAKNTLTPGSIGRLSENSFFTFSINWGSGRGATWQAGFMCFLEQNWLHRLFGVGPDGLAAYLYGNGSEMLQNMVTGRFGTATLTNTHCEWLTVLVDVGAIGMIGFVGMMLSVIVRGFRSETTKGIVGACGLCLLTYTVNNFFSFQQSMNLATMSMILGMLGAYLVCQKQE